MSKVELIKSHLIGQRFGGLAVRQLMKTHAALVRSRSGKAVTCLVDLPKRVGEARQTAAFVLNPEQIELLHNHRWGNLVAFGDSNYMDGMPAVLACIKEPSWPQSDDFNLVTKAIRAHSRVVE